MNQISRFITLVLVGLNYTSLIWADNDCTVKQFEDVKRITEKCLEITIGDLFVPPGETLKLKLLDGAKVTFTGNVTFGVKNGWNGELMKVIGTGITIQGKKGHILNGQGEQYWDTIGSFGTKKPKFLRVANVTGGSLFKNLHIYHAPMHGVAILDSSDTVFTGFFIDNAAGDENTAPLGKAGHNTDGFGIGTSSNLTIENSKIFNQDDCVVINSGNNIVVRNLLCHGSHGLSVSVGMSNDTFEKNAVRDVLIEDSIIINSWTGIHIKTRLNSGKGIISNVTYRDITMLESYGFGISIEQNYTNTLVPGTGAAPSDHIPIENLTLRNIKGTVQNISTPYYVVCAKGACNNWIWEDVNVYGINASSCVNFHPNGIGCDDYEM